MHLKCITKATYAKVLKTNIFVAVPVPLHQNVMFPSVNHTGCGTIHSNLRHHNFIT